MMRRRQTGFTLIELIIFIVVSALLMSTVMMGANFALRQTPTMHYHGIAIAAARTCMESILQSFRNNGYDTYACPITSTSLCAAPSGFTTTLTIACTTWNADSAYKTITVNVSGRGAASVVAQVGDY